MDSIDKTVLASHLFYYFRSRNAALGATEDVEFVRYLAAVASQSLSAQDSANVVKAAFLQGQIKGFQQIIKDKVAQADTPEARKIILPIIERLYVEAQKSSEALKVLRGANG